MLSGKNAHQLAVFLSLPLSQFLSLFVHSSYLSRSLSRSLSVLLAVKYRSSIGLALVILYENFELKVRVEMAKIVWLLFTWWIVFLPCILTMRQSHLLTSNVCATQKGNFMLRWLQKLSLNLLLAINWRIYIYSMYEYKYLCDSVRRKQQEKNTQHLKTGNWSLAFSYALCSIQSFLVELR